MLEVPVLHSYVWDCPECGQENWQRAVYQNLTEEENKEALVILGELEPWQEPDPRLHVEMVSIPRRIFCSRCKVEFKPFFPADGGRDVELDEEDIDTQDSEGDNLESEEDTSKWN